jgi:anti-sigma factor (TIGR02949 family)
MVSDMLDCNQIADMISGYLDGELTQGDRQRVEVHLDSCSGCRRTCDDMQRVRRAVGDLSFEEMPPEEWSKMMNDLTVRTSRGAGWLLYVIGLALVVGYAAYEFSVDEEIPALIKTGIAAAVIGLMLLFISVLRQRLIARKTDKYEDVEI